MLHPCLRLVLLHAEIYPNAFAIPKTHRFSSIHACMVCPPPRCACTFMRLRFCALITTPAPANFAKTTKATGMAVSRTDPAMAGDNWRVWSMRLALTPAQTSAQPEAFNLALVLRKPSALSRVCSQCSTLKKSGKLSCCASGGAWFNKCGDAGDKNFNHTWVDGIQACNGKSSRVDI